MPVGSGIAAPRRAHEVCRPPPPPPPLARSSGPLWCPVTYIASCGADPGALNTCSSSLHRPVGQAGCTAPTCMALLWAELEDRFAANPEAAWHPGDERNLAVAATSSSLVMGLPVRPDGSEQGLWRHPVCCRRSAAALPPGRTSKSNQPAAQHSAASRASPRMPMPCLEACLDACLGRCEPHGPLHCPQAAEPLSSLHIQSQTTSTPQRPAASSPGRLGPPAAAAAAAQQHRPALPRQRPPWPA